MGSDGLGPTIPSTAGKKDHGSDHVNNTNRVIVTLGNNKQNKVNGFSLNKVHDMRFPDHNLSFGIACFERGTQIIFDRNLHCQLKKEMLIFLWI